MSLPTFREVQLIMAAPMTDEEIEELCHQEPLPANQSPQLPSDEPTQNQTEPYLNYYEY